MLERNPILKVTLIVIFILILLGGLLFTAWQFYFKAQVQKFIAQKESVAQTKALLAVLYEVKNNGYVYIEDRENNIKIKLIAVAE